MKLLDGETFYFWCSEKSKLLGSDLLLKMKNLLKRKPTLAELTGISESRLECFATHLRSYLLGPSVSSFQSSSSTMTAPWADVRVDGFEIGRNTQSSISVKPLRTRQSTVQTVKGQTPYQGSLSPRSSSFKEGQPRILNSLRSVSREKVRRRGDLHLPAGSSFMTEAVLNLSEEVKPSETFTNNAVSPLSFLESLGNCSFPESASSTAQVPPPVGSFFSPYYCWCPPCTSPSGASMAKFPASFSEPFSLPPLSSLLPATGTHSILPQMPPLDLASAPSLEFPTFLSDPLTRFSFTKQSSQLPTFTPLMCDPIVHIPVVDVCSSGPGYLVSAGPGIATSIPPLYPNFVGPMMSESESMVDKGARETLRLLIGGSSSQPSASLMGVFPAVLNKDSQDAVLTGSRGLYCGISDVNGIVVAGSRGLYSGISDVNAMVNSFAAVGLTSVSERSSRAVSMKNFSHTSASDALEHTYNSRDLQDSAFMSREQEKD
ncbi:Protein RnfH [Bienertia sinuspersici]